MLGTVGRRILVVATSIASLRSSVSPSVLLGGRCSVPALRGAVSVTSSLASVAATLRRPISPALSSTLASVAAAAAVSRLWRAARGRSVTIAAPLVGVGAVVALARISGHGGFRGMESDTEEVS